MLTVTAALGADVTELLALPPGAFRPAPKVRSAVVRLTFVRAPSEVEDQRVARSLGPSSNNGGRCCRTRCRRSRTPTARCCRGHRKGRAGSAAAARDVDVVDVARIASLLDAKRLSVL